MKKLLLIVAMVVTGMALNANLSSVVVSGYCLDSEEGIPSVQVTCSISTVTPVESDTDGFYAISIPANRSCSLTFSHNSYQSKTKSVSASSSNISDFNVDMSN